MAFDATYLTKTLNQITLHGRTAIIGGAWEVSCGANAWVDLDQESVDVKGIPRATSMTEFVVWDPCANSKVALPVCSLPMQPNYGGVRSEKKARWCVLELVGKVLASSAVVRGIVFDAHASHILVRKVVFGQMQDVDLDAVGQIPFFKEIRHVPLPSNCLPRLPIEVCYIGKDSFFALPGPCFWAE